MDHQGAGRTRSAADTRRQQPWPPHEGSEDQEGTGPRTARTPGYGVTGSGAQPVLSAGTGPQRVLGPGTGPQRLIGTGSGASPLLSRGSGAQPVLRPGSGTQPVPGRGSGAQPVLSRGSGAQPVLSPSSGAQPVLSPGSGAQPVLGAPFLPQAAGPTDSSGRTPARGFPPGREPAEPSAGRPAGDAYPPDDPDDTVFMEPLAPTGADQTGPHGRPGSRRGGRTKRRFRAGWLATAVVVAAAAGFAGYKFLYEPRVNAPVPPTLRLPTTAPGSPGFDKTLGKWQHIGTRAEDSEPLTIAGLYPPQFTLNGSSYTRTAASVTKTCSSAVYGADLQAALQSGHCTQVVRASYVSGDGKMMGTIGVVNLATSSAAQKAGKVTGPQEIIAPLSSRKGATSKLGSGTGIVQAKIKGHYLILMWAEFTSLKSPSGSAQRQALEQFAANLVTGSANINLSTRMLTGKQ
jgi:hypothetical protein